MWLITPVGFFSIVQKSSDQSAGTLTVRARVHADLDALRLYFLPDLSEVKESTNTDYRFRATAPRASVAKAMAMFIEQLDYSNFKNQVAKIQGPKRAHLYHDVWDVLYRLQQDSTYAQSAPSPVAAKSKTLHPRKDDNGKPVEIKKPSLPSSADAWHQANRVACVVPAGILPSAVNGISLKAWAEPPEEKADWLELAQRIPIEEPPFIIPSGYKGAAGVVVREQDGRVWLVAPSNQYGGYQHTFPKGTIEQGMTAQATALVEAYEESGLQVRLLSHLVDVKRSLSFTRYYLAERIGGNPADMGWESQAVLLSPLSQLGKLLNSSYDIPIVEKLHAVAN
ncbi:MAG: NUDIX hydrolase [Limnobacter sp.]|uniref:NUDIX hydrolase n=1 Tax=Limnobacter sp. TaxID=2003368 RepID=UPI0022CB0878|nr:NUDIX hydrolase [Limnobacter sp.]MCZ8016228.1 NUDIX hydrolase [Limnobacter sp.]